MAVPKKKMFALTHQAAQSRVESVPSHHGRL